MSQTTYQVVLSTDGKHKVIASGNDEASAIAAVTWANTVYDRLVAKYGLKHEQYSKNGQEEQGEPKSDDPTPECAVHHVPMQQVQGKRGPFWSCHEQNEDGSWCNYRPKT
jgi:hypothetical protein